MTKGIFCLATDAVVTQWKKSHNEELQNMQFSPSFLAVIKSGRVT
jgi:hypothetical protein